MAQSAGKSGGHALVIGGSMAGLLAARVLADHFERVTILERDRFPAEAGPRKGVPQARRTHILLLRNQLFAPRILAQAVKQGRRSSPARASKSAVG